MDPTKAPSSTSLQQLQPTTQVVINIYIALSPTARESIQALKHYTNHPFVDPASLSFFFNTHIPLWELIEIIFSLRYVLGGLGAASKSHISVKKLFKIIVKFSGHI